MKRKIPIILTLIYIYIYPQHAQAHNYKAFETWGDVWQVLPFVMMGYSWYIEDYEGIKEQAISSAASFLITHAIKESFVLISKSDESKALISRRPNQGSFNGFPSGHTSFAFSSVGFAQKRYGFKFSIPTAAIATSVGVSRIYAQRHTTTQVIAGAALGFATSYLLSSKYNDENKYIGFYLDNAKDGSVNYKLVGFYRF